MKTRLFGLLFSFCLMCVVTGQDGDYCEDFRGNLVAVGQNYQPYEDEPCAQCTCLAEPLSRANSHQRCMMVQCSQPTCQDYIPVPGECCKYTCPQLPQLNSSQPTEYQLSQVFRGRPLPFSELVEPCCDVGRQWFIRSREQCGPFPTAVKGVHEVDQGRCIEMVHLCCIQEREALECEKGRTVARIERRCEVLHGQQQKDQQKTCCSCCLLGIDAAAAAVSCEFFTYRFPDHCAQAFKECCLESSEVRTPAPAITSTTRSSREQVPGGLCSRFEGQLCGDICVDVPGSYRCQCRPGFVLGRDGRTCMNEVVNRCWKENPCDHECVDTGSALTCRCFEGFRLGEDETSCIDINECAEGSFVCRAQQTCVNTEGSYTCVGISGNRRTTTTPAPANPVDVANAHLRCDFGYVWDPVTRRCEDIDECMINRFACDIDEDCVNTPGGFLCQPPEDVLDCGTGFTFNANLNMCQDVDECAEYLHHCIGDGVQCRNTIGNYLCACPDGFSFNEDLFYCEDINECALQIDDCHLGQTCVNSIGSYSCRRTMNCGTGYVLSEETQRCIDIDECELRTANCPTGEECRNIPGSFRCVVTQCPAGFRYNDAQAVCEPVACARGMRADQAGNCIDINECVERSPCRPDQECRNTVGSFVCRAALRCGPGYQQDEASGRCEDMNECLTGEHDCTGPLMRCENRQGAFTCVCPQGYRLDADLRRCVDEDECNSLYGGQVCDINASCENTPGSFRCDCNEGFVDNGKYCIDVNECERAGMCMHECRNTYGSFVCSCERGYELAADARTCVDIDECTMWAEGGGQLCFGVCRNTLGSYECQCPDGYTMEPGGRTCRDINECLLGSVDCDGVDDQCINTRGGYKCETIRCPKGFLRAPQPDQRSNAVRCQRQTFACAQGDTECLYAPLSLSYNFITFPTKIRIPADLFTMRGPQSHHRRLAFELELVSARDPITGSQRTTRDMFRLDHVSEHEALVRLMQEIEGPQDVELRLNMNIYSREFQQEEEVFFGTAVAVIKIYVTADLF